MEKAETKTVKSLNKIFVCLEELSEQQQSKLRLCDIMAWLGLSRGTLWRLRKNKDFPKGKRVSERITVWDRKEIEQWLSEKSNQ